jgi:hypothetical protein
MMLRLGAYDPNEEMLDVYYSSGADVTNPDSVPSGGSFNTILIPGVNTIQTPGTVQPQQQPQQQPPADSGAVYRVTTTAKMPPGLPWGLLILGAVALVMLVRNN